MKGRIKKSNKYRSKVKKYKEIEKEGTCVKEIKNESKNKKGKIRTNKEKKQNNNKKKRKKKKQRKNI